MVKNKTAVFNNDIHFVFCFTEAQKPSTVQQVLIQSLNYSLPPDGLTIDIHVPSGAANVYASYSIPTPSYLTADVMTGGSGNLTLYIPYQDSGIVFVSVLAKKLSTTFLIKTETGNVGRRLSEFNVYKFCIHIKFYVLHIEGSPWNKKVVICSCL